MRIKLLKDRNFGLLMWGKFISLVGTQMQNFALSLYVFKITGSATKFATVLMISMLPQLLLGPIVGVFTDWMDRKKIIVSMDILNGLIIGVYAILFYLNGGLSLGSIYLFVVLLSLISMIFQPAIATVIPSIVKKEDLVDANSMNTFIMNMGNLISPMIAGALFGLYGLFIILLLNSISFILSGISEMFIHIPKVNKAPEEISFKTFSRDLKEGLSFIKNSNILISVIGIAMIVNFVGSPLGSIGFIYISKNVLGVSDLQYGIVEGVASLGMLLSPIICSAMAKKYPLKKLLFYNLLGTGFLIMLVAIVPFKPFLNLFNSNFVPYIALIVVNFFMILLMSIVNISLSIMFQQTVPLNLMGRVNTVMSAGCMATMPLGQLVFGIMYDKVSTSLCVVISAIIIIVSLLAFKNTLLPKDSEDRELALQV
ncbi:MFS transporter [Clostridium sp. MSJ-4]|uniref:MFS transporter n=1 Tax=Clostridium simiarum TaxID=2841506 RepID=A0ABS6EWL9_9CLOT|nr:MFS transporter [Clostridium simiarum]MBU5590388.1 MFS transporter [Clostridium simiarum]